MGPRPYFFLASVYTASAVKPSKKEPLHILLASPRGFCAGVDRAIEVVEEALNTLGPPIYVRHEIVHNKYVVEGLRKKGVVFVDDVDEIPEGAVVIYSAHGVSKAVRAATKARNHRVIDATCPLVTKVHLEAARLDQEGYDILLIGHAGHVEVEGTLGQLPPGRITLVQNPEEAERVEVRNPEKVAFITQTTLSLDETEEVVSVLRRRFPNLRGPARDDICYATQNRQNAVKALLGRIDLLLVIGSKNSSNSNRLVDVARARGVEAHLIDDPGEIDPTWLEGVRVVGLTAGASAPEMLVERTIERLLAERGGEVEPFVLKEEKVDFPLPKELAAVTVG